MTKPRIVVSRCLGYEACRYDGGIISVNWKDRLANRADVVTVCPEVLAGLGVPRDPINLHRIEGKLHVIQEGSGKNWTDELEQASNEILSNLGETVGFILKSKSPSCGLGTTKVHFGDSIYISSGLFAKKAMEKYEDARFTDEVVIEREGIDAFLDSL